MNVRSIIDQSPENWKRLIDQAKNPDTRLLITALSYICDFIVIAIVVIAIPQERRRDFIGV